MNQTTSSSEDSVDEQLATSSANLPLSSRYSLSLYLESDANQNQFNEAAPIGSNLDSECPLRFYKGLAGRDHRKQSAVSVAASVAVTSLPSKRTRKRRWPERRPRCVQQVAEFEQRHNSTGAQSQQQQQQQSQEKTPGMQVADLSAYDPDLVARLLRTSTIDSRSSSSQNIPCDGTETENMKKLIDNSPVKIQYIYNNGRLLPVEVMKWPDMPTIPTYERYRLEEPMKTEYGKRSALNRVIKSLQKAGKFMDGPKQQSIGRQPIPLLPRRMTETTKERLMLWYKPLGHSGDFHGTCEVA